MVRRYLLLMQLWTHALCGSMTYYNPAGGLGSCGNALFDGDYVAAMNAVEYSLDRCGQTICISYGGKTVQAVIADRCAGCSAGDVDVTPVIFEAFQPLSVGRFDVTWDYCGGGGGGSGSGGNGRQEQPSQQPSPSPPPPPSPASSSVESVMSRSPSSTSASTASAVSSSTTTLSSTSVSSTTLSASQSASTLSTANSNDSSKTGSSSAATDKTGDSGTDQFVVPLGAAVVWPKVVDPTRPLSKRNKCFVAN